MSRRTMRMAVLALACVLAGRLAVADAGPGKERKTDQRVQVVYPVADLVVPIQGDTLKRTADPCQLMELMRSTVAPTSWVDHGGSGTIQYYPKEIALVVRQSPAVQRQVADLLKALRRLQEVEVCVELRVVQLSEELAKEFRARAGFEPAKTADKTVAETVFLTEKELYPWMRLWQTDPATNFHMAPKVTMLSGQQGHIAVGDPQSEAGMRCELLPTVSADRRFVQLKVDFQHAALALKHACTIADGRTMVVPLGNVMAEGRTEIEPCVLSKIPYVNRLVRNVGYSRESRAVFLMVTPRVIVTEEEEQVFFSDLPPMPRP